MSIEVGMAYLFNWGIGLWYITTVIMITLHILLLRFMVGLFVFQWKAIMMEKITFYKRGRGRAGYFIKKLKMLRSLINELIEDDSSYKEIQHKLLEGISKCRGVTMQFITIYESILIIPKQLSKRQILFLESLRALNSCLNNPEITNDADYSSVISNDDIPNISLRKTLLEIVLNSNIIIKQLKKYSCKGSEGFSFNKLIQILTNDLLFNLNISRVIYEDDFETNEIDKHQLVTKDNKVIDYVILKSQHCKGDKPNLLILSGPNGGPFELTGLNNFTALFLDNGIDILRWNYRGYGYSTGLPSFTNTRSDIVELYDDIIKLNQWNKIASLGRSIGGIPCCYLANHRPIDLLISDRNFSSIQSVLKGMHCGVLLNFFYNILCVGSSNTLSDYLNSTCYKIILNDPMDEIINDFGSVKTQVSSHIIKHNLRLKSILDNEIVDIQTGLSEGLVSSNPIQETSRNYDSILEALLTKRERSNLFEALIYCAENLNNKGFWKEFNDEVMRIKNLTILNEDYANSIRELLMKFFYSFTNTTDNFSVLIDYKSSRRKRMFIDTFFNNLFIWGTTNVSFNEDEVKLYSVNSVQGEINKVTKRLEELAEVFNNEKLTTMTISHKVELMIVLFGKIEYGYDKIYIQSEGSKKNIIDNRLQSSVSMEYIKSDEGDMMKITDCLLSAGRGHYIKLRSGHNGLLNANELTTLKYHLEQSNFLN